MIKEVIIICKTHLDIGFTGYAEDIKQHYLENYLEQALKVSGHFRKQDNDRNYVWTVGSWLAEEMLQKLEPQRKQKMVDAIQRGDFVWHALPFTMHCELNNAFMMERSLDISKRLDQQFERKTIAAKMTDVPGHTRGIVAPFADAGVKLLHIGINPASAIVDLPPAFNWQDSNGKTVSVIYQKDYGNSFLLPDNETLMWLDMTGDNLGPHSIDVIEDLYQKLEADYPNATVYCGTLDDIAEHMVPYASQLPTINSEIGDSWIHGVGTDPVKTAQYRALINWRKKHKETAGFEQFDSEILQVSEHTWGMDEKSHFKDEMPFLGLALEQLQKSDIGQRFAKSWQEQREIIPKAISMLPENYQNEAQNVYEQCIAVKPDLHHFESLDVSEPIAIQNKQFSGTFGLDGSISLLKCLSSGVILADDTHPLYQFSGETFNADDYQRFHSQYNRLGDEWVVWDFTKPNLPKDLKHLKISPELKECFYKKQERGDNYIFKLAMPSTSETGMPEEIYLNYLFDAEAPVIDVQVSWFNKYPARIPHALYLNCKPLTSQFANWTFNKMAEQIDPTDIASNGGRGLHAVSGPITCSDENRKELTFISHHTPLVVPGKPKLLNFDNELPDMTNGISYNLYNNIWGTNFPMWFGDDTTLEFTILIDSNE